MPPLPPPFSYALDYAKYIWVCTSFTKCAKTPFIIKFVQWKRREDFLKTCGPPPGNNFDLEVGQRSRPRHGVNWKGLTQGPCMSNINTLSLILQKIWTRLKFLWQADARTEGQTDGRMSFNAPRFRERRTEGQTDGRMSFNVPRFRERWGIISQMYENMHSCLLHVCYCADYILVNLMIFWKLLSCLEQ